MTPFIFLLATLATYRIVRLWLYDLIAEPLRERVLLAVGGEASWRRWLLDLLSCQWCLGVHVAFWVTVAWFLYSDAFTGFGAVVPFGITWLALSAAQSFVHLLEDRVGNL